MMSSKQTLGSEVRGVVLDIGGLELLVPSATMAEVVYCDEPKPHPSAPLWLLGMVTWRDRKVPLVSVRAGGEHPREVRRGPRARTAICYSPNPGSALPYVGILAVGPPRLTVFRAEAMRPAELPHANPFVLHALTYMDRPAWIPNMDAIEAAVLDAVSA
ncbi:MAG: chemotaxis protein CheW [Chromatiaceae bacterium]|jgi:chemotaxis signal transduction protein